LNKINNLTTNNKYKQGNLSILELLKKCGVSGLDDVKKFTEPQHWLKYFYENLKVYGYFLNL
jgi:hypothetical protein